MLFEYLFQQGGIIKRTFVKRTPSNSFPMAIYKVIQYNRLVSILIKILAHVRSDVTSSPDNENIDHLFFLSTAFRMSM